MKLRLLALLIVGISLAAMTGWLMDVGTTTAPQSKLQAPDNIDYYMKRVDYRAFDVNGSLQMHMVTPFMEHYIREDVSQLTAPRIDYFGLGEVWKAQSESGTLVHQDESITLTERVDLRRTTAANPMELRSEIAILRSREDLMEIPSDMVMLQPGLTLHAGGAIIDMKNKRHQFTRVKAVYQDPDNAAG